jgi:hypothetical protein
VFFAARNHGTLRFALATDMIVCANPSARFPLFAPFWLACSQAPIAGLQKKSHNQADQPDIFIAFL